MPRTDNLRSSLSRWFAQDRLVRLAQPEIEAADAQPHHVADQTEALEAEGIEGAHERAGAADAPLAAPAETHVSETANTPSSVIATEPVKKPKKGSTDGNVQAPKKESE